MSFAGKCQFKIVVARLLDIVHDITTLLLLLMTLNIFDIIVSRAYIVDHDTSAISAR